MRLLLDENLPKRLKLNFPEHEVFTVRDKQWNGIKNGELLKRLLDNSFDALLTFDKNLQHQQNFLKYTITVFVLTAKINQYIELSKLTPKINEYLNGGQMPIVRCKRCRQSAIRLAQSYSSFVLQFFVLMPTLRHSKSLALFTGAHWRHTLT